MIVSRPKNYTQKIKKFLLQDKKWQRLQNQQIYILQQKKCCGWVEPAIYPRAECVPLELWSDPSMRERFLKNCFETVLSLMTEKFWKKLPTHKNYVPLSCCSPPLISCIKCYHSLHHSELLYLWTIEHRKLNYGKDQILNRSN